MKLILFLLSRLSGVLMELKRIKSVAEWSFGNDEWTVTDIVASCDAMVVVAMMVMTSLGCSDPPTWLAYVRRVMPNTGVPLVTNLFY